MTEAVDIDTSQEDIDIDLYRDEIKEYVLSDTPYGFEWFWICIYNRPFEEHWKPWIAALYEAHEKQKGTLIEAFRYSWKTTVLTNAFLAYRIGLEPHKTNLIIQVKDETAEQTAAAVAKIIEENPVWKWFFPEVIPDYDRGWGHRGYYVKRDDEDYGEWLRQCGRDPTFVGYGVGSDSIIGKHPNGVLLLDDVHNEGNTSSARELAKVISILTGTIFPTIDPESTWVCIVGTPWVYNDTLGYVKATGNFVCIKTTVTKDGTRGGEPTWPENFDQERLAELRSLVGDLEFDRMYLCNIEAAEGLELKKDWLHVYPSDRINPTWSVVFGIDYASLSDILNPGNRDYFALAVGAVIPNGGMVIIDGVYEKLTQAEAELRVSSMARLYPTLQAIGYENLGGAKEAFNILLRTTNLPLIPFTKGNRKKREIYHKVLAPAFQSTRLRITDAPNKFVIAFKNEWLTYPAAQHDDALDAVFYCARAGADYLLDFNAPDRDASSITITPKPLHNPWGSFAGRRGRDQ
jgi:hypothetical protein